MPLYTNKCVSDKTGSERYLKSWWVQKLFKILTAKVQHEVDLSFAVCVCVHTEELTDSCADYKLHRFTPVFCFVLFFSCSRSSFTRQHWSPALVTPLGQRFTCTLGLFRWASTSQSFELFVYTVLIGRFPRISTIELLKRRKGHAENHI